MGYKESEDGEVRIYLTGITGTVGTAFTEYLYDDHELYGIDRNEERAAQFKKKYPAVNLKFGDFIDANLEGMQLVIHLAAMKHVDLCEQNANECVMNNVVKTYQLFRKAHANKVDILFMSTDKAVEPICTYGYSKALGEAMALEHGGAVIRSGNITASTGSVLNVWDEAIQNKEPILITHKDMRRYFISADNLVKRAWSKYVSGATIIIPEMDKEIGLMDLLKEKLDSAGYTVENYPGGVEFIGLRSGEKIIEKLDWDKK